MSKPHQWSQQVNINAKTTSNQEVSGVQFSALSTLDGQMAASGYGANHPWRRQLASTMAAPYLYRSKSAESHALDAVDMAGVGASFLNDNIYPVIDSLVALTDFESKDIGATNSRLSMIKDLAKVVRHLVEDAAGHMEACAANMQSKVDALRGAEA